MQQKNKYKKYINTNSSLNIFENLLKKTCFDEILIVYLIFILYLEKAKKQEDKLIILVLVYIFLDV